MFLLCLYTILWAVFEAFTNVKNNNQAKFYTLSFSMDSQIFDFLDFFLSVVKKDQEDGTHKTASSNPGATKAHSCSNTGGLLFLMVCVLLRKRFRPQSFSPLLLIIMFLTVSTAVGL